MRAPDPSQVMASLPESAAGLVKAILAAANERRLAVYLVGGPVRDLLLGLPISDVDLIVEGSDGSDAAELGRAVEHAGARVTRHDRFGTISLRTDDVSIDLATVRRETYLHDGALPSVEPGTLEDDLRRRDFTVNALALPLSDQACSQHVGIVDFADGLLDLVERRLRVLHARSFHDDPTRALRAARLGPRLGFTLSRGSRPALRDALRDGAFGRVSGDRLRREFVKLFDDCRLGLDPSRALRLLAEWHVLGALEPGLGLASESTAPLRRLGRAIQTPPWRRGRCRPWVVGLALWFAPAAASQRRRALQRLSVRGETAERVSNFGKARDSWLRALQRARGRGAIDAVLRQLDEEDLLGLFATVGASALRRRIVRYAVEDRSRRAPVTGDDLIGIGLEGPALGPALARIRAAYLDGAVSNREEALALGRELLRRRGAVRKTAVRNKRRGGR